MIGWVATAFAGSLAGTSLSSVGGGFAGVTEPGALGLLTQPTASARGEAPELAVDGGAVATRFEQWLADWEEPLSNRGVATQPTLLVSVPVRRFGFGAAVFVPYLRGTNYEPDGPQRLFTVKSTLSLYELDLTGSYAVNDWLTLGGGLRSGLMTYENLKGTDFGATLNRKIELDPPLPIGEPLLLGSQRIGRLQAVTTSFILGATVDLDAMQLDVSFRPQWNVPLRGPVQLQPSNALDATIDGTIDLTLKFPAHVLVAGRIPVGQRWTLIPEVEWVGWNAASNSSAVVSNLSLSSENDAFDTVLTTTGLTESEFIKSQEGPLNADLRWHDVFNGSFQAVFVPREDIELRAGVGYAPSAIDKPLTTPSNIDFGGARAKLAAAWRVHPAVRVAVTGEAFHLPERQVRNSPYTLDSPPDGQALFPSGNGNYKLSVLRAGLTLQLFLPSRGS